MKNPIVSICLSAALLLAAIRPLAAADSATKSEAFAPKGGRFTVHMPGPVKEQINKVKTALGPIDIHLFVFSPDPDTAYIVAYSDYPDEMVKKASNEELLDGARDGAVKDMNGKLDSEKKITIGKYPGRDVVIAVEGAECRDRMYMVNSRLYQVMLVGSKEFVTGKEAEKFFDSFKLTDK